MPQDPAPDLRRQALPDRPGDVSAGRGSFFRMRHCRGRGVMRRVCLVASLLICATQDAAGGTDEAGAEFFERRVRPLLAEHCYGCHSAKAEKVKAGLLVDSREGLLKGGESGPAVVAGKPEQSRLIEAVRYSNPEFQMPPRRRLSDEQVAALVRWVELGAPWSGGGRAGDRAGGTIRHGAAAGHALGLAARARIGATGCRRRGVGAEPRRPLHPRPARSRGPATGAARGPSFVAPADPLRAARAAPDAGGGRGLSRGPVARCPGAGRRPAAGFAALRRAMGPALDGPRPLQRHARQRSRHAHPQRLALSRLPGPRLQRRPALRSAHPRTPRRRPARRAPAAPRWERQRVGPRHRLLLDDRGQAVARRPAAGPGRLLRQPPRRDGQDLPGPDRRLRPLPRPQVRPGHPGGLLRPLWLSEELPIYPDAAEPRRARRRGRPDGCAPGRDRPCNRGGVGDARRQHSPLPDGRPPRPLG